MRRGAVLMSVATSSRGHSNEWSGDRQTPDLPMLRGWMRCYLTTSATDTPMRTEMSEASKAMPIQIAAGFPGHARRSIVNYATVTRRST